jgi:hypothetical protein
MNGTTVSGGGNTSLNPGGYTATTGWQVVGVGDFNGDGKADVLFRNAGTGVTRIWFMNGTTVSGGGNTSLNPGGYISTTGWRVIGVGDFNADGKADILLRYAQTGQTAIWFMNGITVSGGGNTSLNPGGYTATTGWQVVGVGDFNGDGKADILLRYAQTGQTAIWFMNGTTVSGGGNTSASPGAYTLTTGWQIQVIRTP